MGQTFDELRRRVLVSGGEYQTATAKLESGGAPRHVSMVIMEMKKTLWHTKDTVRSWTGSADTIIWPRRIEGEYLAPPVKRFGGMCTTEFVLREKMVSRRLWDEAQASLRWLMTHQPSAAASSRQKAEWITKVYEWAGIATLASCLNTDFWFVPEEALEPRCTLSTCADFQRATLDCCPVWSQDQAWTVALPAGAARDRSTYLRAATTAYSAAPDPRLWLHEIQAQVRRQYGCNAPERGCQIGGFVTPYPPGTTRTDRFWLKYELGPNWVLPPGTPGGGADVFNEIAYQPDANWAVPGAIPDAVLAQIDSAATRDFSRAERAHSTFTSLPMVEQLTTIFEVLGASTNVVQPTLRGWTVATPVGLLEQARRTAAFWASMNLDRALGRAMLFYTANHLQYFAARGELGIPVGEIESAYRTLRSRTDTEIGLILGGSSALLSMASGPVGLVASVILGLVNVWSTATGWSMSDPFGIATAIKTFRIPQPIFMRVMPECEELSRLRALDEGLPIGNVPPLNDPAPGPPIGLVVGGAAVVGGLVGWLLGR